MCNKLVLSIINIKKIYLVVTDSIIQADGVLFEGRAEAKRTVNDLNETQNIIECKYPLLRYLEVYETLINDQLQNGTSGNACCVKRVTAYLNSSNFR